MNNDNLYSPKLPYVNVVDPFYSVPSWGGGSRIFTFKHLDHIILQQIDNFSIAEVVGKSTFYLLVCKESFELVTETENLFAIR